MKIGRIIDMPEYWALKSMKARCLNPKHKSYQLYGGRGISVCKEWLRSSAAFLKYVGRRPSPDHQIDRINNNGHYEPGNIRWATRVEQGRNRRTNKFLTIDSETHCIAEWADIHGLDRGTFRSRLAAGVDPKIALLTPSIPIGRREVGGVA